MITIIFLCLKNQFFFTETQKCIGEIITWFPTTFIRAIIAYLRRKEDWNGSGEKKKGVEENNYSEKSDCSIVGPTYTLTLGSSKSTKSKSSKGTKERRTLGRHPP